MPKADVGVFGGSGFYSFLDDVEEVEVDTPYGKPSAPFTIGDVGGDTRRLSSAPRPPARAPAARDPVPGESLGHEGARRAANHRAERLGRAHSRPRARRVRRLRPVRRPDERARRHVLRRARDDARLGGRPLLPRPAPSAGRDGRRARHQSARRRDRGRRSRAPASRRGPSRSGSRRRAGTSST